MLVISYFNSVTMEVFTPQRGSTGEDFLSEINAINSNELVIFSWAYACYIIYFLHNFSLQGGLFGLLIKLGIPHKERLSLQFF